MSPPAAKRDELVTVLLERLDRFESSLSAVQQALARMEQSEEQARSLLTQAHMRADAHELRITALEASKHRAEGAAWAGKLAWAVGLAFAGAVGAVAHYVLR